MVTSSGQRGTLSSQSWASSLRARVVSMEDGVVPVLLGHPNFGGARGGPLPSQPPLSSTSQNVRMKLYPLVPALVCKSSTADPG